MKEERHLAYTKDHSLEETQAAKAMIESKLEAKEAAEKKDSELWYFTHS